MVRSHGRSTLAPLATTNRDNMWRNFTRSAPRQLCYPFGFAGPFQVTVDKRRIVEKVTYALRIAQGTKFDGHRRATPPRDCKRANSWAPGNPTQRPQSLTLISCS